MNSFSLFDLILQASFAVKLVMLLLLSASIASWAIIFDKWKVINKQIKNANDFEQDLWSGKVIEELYEKVKKERNNVIASIFIAGIKEFQSERLNKNHLLENKKDYIYQAMHVEFNKSMDMLEKNVGFLATIGSAAPFIGLFGTVWGIMTSFQTIAAAQNVNLAVVAPGVTEALFATAIGLVVAIPATIFYNKFITSLNRFSNRLNNFIMEFGSLLIKEIK